ncbi:STAS domain-containing protein [Cellulomonas dongxiuzhuiae]|uniref:STAS domain-containing protein n=1 Tax=Cellulomonas dongxiuzhuiae TaxID=2819979 RepID=UPI001AAF2D5A|nr:STAS domain-containing protein [Cellulomonas dongxiuzhuiae]MBO3089892.1 STAS domain-containing protein [Cellulomonas dongxiuzhuiae]
MPSSSPFFSTRPGSITVVTADGPSGPRALVRLAGEVDVLLRDQADAALAQVVALGLPVVIDLAEARLVGATALTFLVRCEDACSDAGLPYVVQHVTPHVARVLGALGLDAVLRHVEGLSTVSS